MRNIREIQRDLASNRAHTARGGQVRPGSLRELEAELRAALRHAPRRATAADVAAGIPMYDLVPAGQATRARPKPAPVVPQHVHTAPFNRSALLVRALRAGALDPSHLETATYAAKRDLALSVLEHECGELPPSSVDKLDGLVRRTDSDINGRAVASWIIAAGTRRYSEVFWQAMRYSKPAWTPEQAAALDLYRRLMPRDTLRAMAEGTTGGLAVPVPIDPTVVIGAALEDARILQVAKIVQTTSDTWKGVSSTGGGGFTLPGEGTAVADGSPTFSQPAISIFAPKDWIPFSIEVGQDYPGFAEQMASIFQADYLDRVALDTAIGAGGTSAPMGIFTRMAATTSNPSHVSVTTPGAIIGDDVRAVWAALPERSKNDTTCAWMMSDSVWQRISALAAPQAVNGLSPHDVRYVPAAELTTPGNGPLLFGKPVVISSHCPAFSGTTGAASFAVVGAFSRFAVAQRIGGFTTELVSVVPDFTNGGRPTGQSGFLAIARYGSDVLDVSAFRLLANS